MGHQQKIEVILELEGDGWMAVRYDKPDSQDSFMGMLLRSNSHRPDAPCSIQSNQVESWQAALKREQQILQRKPPSDEGREESSQTAATDTPPQTENQLSASCFRLSSNLRESEPGSNTWRKNVSSSLLVQRNSHRLFRLRPAGSRVLCMKCSEPVESVTSGAAKRKMSINEKSSEKRDTTKKLKVISRTLLSSAPRLKPLSVPLTRVSAEDSRRFVKPQISTASTSDTVITCGSGESKGLVLGNSPIPKLSLNNQSTSSGEQRKPVQIPTTTSIVKPAVQKCPVVSMPLPAQTLGLTFAYTKSPLGGSPRVTPVVPCPVMSVSKAPPLSPKKPPSLWAKDKGSHHISPSITGPASSQGGRPPPDRSLSLPSSSPRKQDSSQSLGELEKQKSVEPPKLVLPKMKIRFGSDGKMAQITRERENGIIEKVPVSIKKRKKKQKQAQREREREPQASTSKEDVIKDQDGNKKEPTHPPLLPFVAVPVSNPEELKVGDIVWAKMPSEPYWPSEIFSFSSMGETCVLWLGSKMHGWVQLGTLSRFRDTFPKRYNKKRTTGGYQKAVCIAIKKLALQGVTDTSWYDSLLSPAAWREMGGKAKKGKGAANKKRGPKTKPKKGPTRTALSTATPYRPHDKKEPPIQSISDSQAQIWSPPPTLEDEGAEIPEAKEESVLLHSAPELLKAEATPPVSDDEDDTKLVIDEDASECPEDSETTSPVKGEEYFQAALAGLQEITQLCSKPPRTTSASC